MSRRRYTFLPHQNRRERLRRLRQAYCGQLPPEQFVAVWVFAAAQQTFLRLVTEGKA